MSEQLVLQDPSLHVGNLSLVDPNEDLKSCMLDVAPMLENNDDAGIDQYIAQRIRDLGVDSVPALGINNDGTDKFIGPQTEMVLASLLTKPYRLDDDSAYEAAVPYIKEEYKALTSRLPAERAYLNAVLHGANLGQATYFGSISGDLDRRMSVAADIVSESEEVDPYASIADFKTSAQCQERAAITHNTLKIFGVNSTFETGTVGVINEDGIVDSEPHAFLTITGSDNSRYIFDPTNPILVKNEEGKVIWLRPALHKLNVDSQGRQTVKLVEQSMINGKREQTRERSLVYTLNPMQEG